MADASDLTARIEAVASAAKVVEVDGLKAEQQSLSDLIATDRYLKSGAAAKKPLRGMRVTTLIPPGAV